CAAVRPPGRAPRPDVAGDVVEPETVGGEPLDRRRALEAVWLQVLPGEAAEPPVGHDPDAGLRGVARPPTPARGPVGPRPRGRRRRRPRSRRGRPDAAPGRAGSSPALPDAASRP